MDVDGALQKLKLVRAAEKKFGVAVAKAVWRRLEILPDVVPGKGAAETLPPHVEVWLEQQSLWQSPDYQRSLSISPDPVFQAALDMMAISTKHRSVIEDREPHFVYVAKNETGCRKIGASKNPESRVAQLSSAAAGDIVLEAVVACVGRAEAFRRERRAHCVLISKRVRSEWFCCSLEDALRAINEQ